MKATIPIGLQPGTRALRLERVPKHGGYLGSTNIGYEPRQDGHWCIWLHHDRDFKQGTVLQLHDDGHIDQVTFDEDGVPTHYIKVKGPDSG